MNDAVRKNNRRMQVSPGKGSPAEVVVAMCGGPDQVARWLGLHPRSVYKWMGDRCEPAAGLIPERYVFPIIQEARAEGIDLRPDHFFPHIPPLYWREKRDAKT